MGHCSKTTQTHASCTIVLRKPIRTNRPAKQKETSMSNKYLIVVDMQNDFIDGALGTPEAQAIVENVVRKVQDFPGHVIFTLDTHQPDYLQTQEGKNLPVEHCIEGAHGWQLADALETIRAERDLPAYRKVTFGSVELAQDLARKNAQEPIESIELVGLCTDICVVSNALMLKGFMPEVPISVDARCCAGVTPEAQDAALATMASCQIAVER